MAETFAGEQLTQLHRRRQLALRSATLKDLLRLWPMFDIDDIDGTWPQLQAALLTLVGARRQDSVGLASNYYRAFRLAEGVPGQAEPRRAAPPDPLLTVATLNLLGPIQAKKNISLRRPRVAETTFTRLAGSVGRQVLNGGRETLVQSIDADRRAAGWRRITDSNPCDFCADIASAGIHSEAGGFPAHDSCGCSAEPAFS